MAQPPTELLPPPKNLVNVLKDTKELQALQKLHIIVTFIKEDNNCFQ